MIFIFEGLDKTGKTTLARRVADARGARYVKVGPPRTRRPFQEYVAMFARCLPGRDHVLDRAHLGQRAYGPVCRGEDLTDAEQLYLDLLAWAKDAVLVYAERTGLALGELRADDLATPDNAAKIHAGFHRAIERVPYPLYLYHDFDRVTKTALTVINKARTPAAPWLPKSFLGCRQPDLVFLADKRSTAVRRNTAHPILASRCGLFLMEALLAAFGLKPLFKLAPVIVNQYDLTDRQLAQMLTWTRVVCLGLEAAARVEAIDGAARLVNHPQHAMRFGGPHGHAVAHYAARLREAVDA